MIGVGIGGIAAMIASVFWALLALGIIYLLFRISAVVEAIRATIDGVRQETVPLLHEVTTTVTSVNRELDRVDGMLESASKIVESAERLTKTVEQTVSNPMIKFAAWGAGLTRAFRRVRKD